MIRLLLLSSLMLSGVTRQNCTNLSSDSIIRQNVSILFYNVENLYDPYDDSTTLDDEFTREGSKKYTWSKFRIKLNHLAKTIITAGGWDTVAFIGMCEIENRYVLNKLIYETPLSRFGYRIIHRNSPDLRGVDVAALYHPKKMTLLSFQYHTIRFPEDTSIRTREILYVKALLFGRDTLHLFVNHWPSRRGGQEASGGRRSFVAGVLRHLTDSVRAVDPLANILITGDFNDDPQDKSLSVHLGAATSRSDTSFLFNLTALKKLPWTEGTIRYRGRWSSFDQFIVSAPMLDGRSGLITSASAVTICHFPFLVQDDPVWFGEKLNRTYSGPRFLGGFSDHLPVLIKLENGTE